MTGALRFTVLIVVAFKVSVVAVFVFKEIN